MLDTGARELDLIDGLVYFSAWAETQRGMFFGIPDHRRSLNLICFSYSGEKIDRSNLKMVYKFVDSIPVLE